MTNMQTTDWSHLPNAKHIDWVIASLTEHPKKWSATWNRIIDAPNCINRQPVYDTAYDIVVNSLRHSEWRAVTNTVWAIDGPYWAARSVVLALIAWDDCAYMIESGVGELELLAKLGDLRAILLWPACIIFNKTKVTV